MDRREEPSCSNSNNTGQNERTSDASRIPLNASNFQTATPATPRSFYIATELSSESTKTNPMITTPLIITQSHLSPSILCQNLLKPSPISLSTNLPPTLFIQALSKLNESSLSLSVLRRLKLSPLQSVQLKSGDITPPDSLASAPPSYSFVLRQMAARRRPRLMGTFIPSPSFVQHTPPPNYGTAFDIYVDNPVPPPPSRVYHFGFASMPAVCPECGYTGMTVVTTKITLCTHMCAFLLCVFCCWICAPLPYILRSCKDVYHHCRSCRNFLGMYCPTNPDNTYS